MSRYIVAVTRWGAASAAAGAPHGVPDDDDFQIVARTIGGVLYEVRLKLVAPLPVVVGPLAGLEQARALLLALRARAHGAVACDADQVVSAADMSSARRFAFTATALDVESTPGHQATMPFDELLAIVRASSTQLEETSTTTMKKQFSVGRAALSSGLLRSRQTSETSVNRDIALEQVAYLFRKSGRDPMLLREHQLEYRSLGPRLQPTTGQNFRTVMQLLTERAPHAVLDERLVSQKRRSSMTRAAAVGNVSRTESSNQAETDLAAHVIALAHLQGEV